MRPDDFDANKLGEELEGTCESIFEMLPEGMNEDDLTQDDLEIIDNLVFQCTACGWWCGIDMMVNDENECGNCA